MAADIAKVRMNFLLDKAGALLQEGKSLHGMQILNSLIEQFPEAEEPVIKLGIAYQNAGNPDAAIALYLEAIERIPEPGIVNLTLANIYFKSKQWQKVIDLLSGVNRHKEPMSSFLIGASHFMLHDYEFARHFLLQNLKDHPDSDFRYTVRVYLAKICLQEGKIDEAYEHLKIAEIMFSNHYEIRLLYAIIYYHEQMYQNALDSIERSLELFSDNPSSYEWAGKICLKCKKYEAAEKYFRRYMEEENEIKAEVYAGLGDACLHTKKVNEARGYFETALKLNPDDKTASRGLQKIKTEKYKYKE